MDRFLKLTSLLLLILTNIATGSAVFAAQISPKDALQAAISYNLAKFIYRVGGAEGAGSDPVSFCILENASLVPALRKMVSKDKSLRPVKLLEISRHEGFYKGCDISYLGETALRHISPEKLATAGSITISDAPEFLDAGGGIQLIQQNNKIAFSLNIPAITVTGKALSSHVIKLAHDVRTRP